VARLHAAVAQHGQTNCSLVLQHCSSNPPLDGITITAAHCMDETGNLFLQHGDVCEHLKEIQKKLKAATTQDRIQKKRKENLCTPYQRWVALFLFSFTHCKSTTPAVLYLEQTMAKSKWKKNLDKEKSKTLVEDWYLALSDEETLALLQPESAIMKKSSKPSQRFLFRLQRVNMDR